MDSLGICLGASTVSLTRLRNNSGVSEVVWSQNHDHEGNPRRCLTDLLGKVEDIKNLNIAVTGRKFRKLLTLSSISEPEAVELAYRFILPPDHPCKLIVSAGGETFMVYHLDEDGRIQDIHTGNKCASGTGEFLIQQLGRMGLTLDDVRLMELPETFYKMSGRCSVFCKSDCTHALNKGVPKEQIVAGLSFMMAAKIIELLKKFPKSPVMLVGGCSHNHAMVHYLRNEIGTLLIPPEAPWFEALGAALWALDNETSPFTGLEEIFGDRSTSLSFHKPLNDYKQKVHFKTQQHGVAAPHDTTIVGLDVGSTTTKGVIMRRQDKAILASEYLRTNEKIGYVVLDVDPSDGQAITNRLNEIPETIRVRLLW